MLPRGLPEKPKGPKEIGRGQRRERGAVLGTAVGLGTRVQVAENKMKQIVPGPCFSQTSLSENTESLLQMISSPKQ